jgi:hypothetical protein
MFLINEIIYYFIYMGSLEKCSIISTNKLNKGKFIKDTGKWLLLFSGNNLATSYLKLPINMLSVFHHCYVSIKTLPLITNPSFKIDDMSYYDKYNQESTNNLACTIAYYFADLCLLLKENKRENNIYIIHHLAYIGLEPLLALND